MYDNQNAKSVPKGKKLIIIQLITLFLALWQLFLFEYTLKWDAIDITLPWRYFSTDALRNGILPLWNPYQHQGFAHGTSPETWYPVGLLLGICRGYGLYSLNLEYLIHLGVAAIGFYKLAVTLGANRFAAAWGSLIFPLSGFFVGNAQHMGWVVSGAWTPLLFHTYLRFRQNYHWRYGVYFVLVCFMMLTGGYIAYSIVNAYVLLTIFCIGFWQKYSSRAPLRPDLIQNVRLALLALALASVVIVCLIELKSNIDRGEGLSGDSGLVGSLYFKHLISFLFPYTTVKGTFDYWHADQALMNLYVGLPALLLAGLSFALIKERFFRIAWCGVLVALALSFGQQLPFRQWLNLLPLFDLFRLPSLFRYYAILIILLIAARTLTIYLTAHYDQLIRLLSRSAWILLILFALSILLAIIFFPELCDRVMNLEITGVGEALLLQLALHSAILGMFCLATYYGKNLLSFPLILIVFSAIDMTLATQLNGRVSIFSEDILEEVQSCIDELPQGYPQPDLEEDIGSNLDRGLYHSYLYRNTNTLYKRIGWDGYTPFQYRNYIALENSTLHHKSKGLPALYVSLYRPRDTTLDYFTSYPDLELTREELVINDFTPNQVDLTCDAEKLRLLVYNQNLISGWKGYANGEAMQVVKTDIGLAGFVLKPGLQVVTLVYCPGNLINSLIISVSLLLILLLILWIRSLRQKNPLAAMPLMVILVGYVAWEPVELYEIESPEDQTLINHIDELSMKDSTEVNGRYLDRKDLPAFKQRVTNLQTPFLYFERPLCSSQSAIFREYLRENYHITDTLTDQPYTGYLCRTKINGETPIVSSTQGFEGFQAGWSLVDRGIVIDSNGNHLQDVGDIPYSATYEYLFDSTTKIRKIHAAVDFKGASAATSMVVDISNGDQNLYWKSFVLGQGSGIALQRQVWELSPQLKVPDGARMKVYVWNPDRRPCVIDNFTVQIF